MSNDTTDTPNIYEAMIVLRLGYAKLNMRYGDLKAINDEYNRSVYGDGRRDLHDIVADWGKGHPCALELHERSLSGKMRLARSVEIKPKDNA